MIYQLGIVCTVHVYKIQPVGKINSFPSIQYPTLLPMIFSLSISRAFLSLSCCCLVTVLTRRHLGCLVTGTCLNTFTAEVHMLGEHTSQHIPAELRGSSSALPNTSRRMRHLQFSFEEINEAKSPSFVCFTSRRSVKM